MRIFIFLITLFSLTIPALAQSDAEEDKGYLQGFLEDTLSDVGRDIRITGFQGALSSNAQLDELTIADDQGIWLTLKGVSLIWSRSALLRGRLEIDELSAAEIIIPRKPIPAGGVSTEDAEAQPFALPELPVSVNIASLKIGLVDLGAPVLGQAVQLGLDGSLSLDGGQGAADINISRIGTNDQIDLNAAYANQARQLSIDLQINEDRDGLMSGLIGLPGRPSLSLSVIGDAPLSDFTADIALKTDQELRLSGEVRLYEEDTKQTTETNAESNTGTPSDAQHFSARLGGDIRTLFTPDMHAFFGDNTMLHLSGKTGALTGIAIDTLMLKSALLDLNGSLNLSPDGWPEGFHLKGLIVGDGPVTLPVSGGQTEVTSVRIAADYDHKAGDAWHADIAIADLNSPEASVGNANLKATGTISKEVGNAITALLSFDLNGLSLPDKTLSDAVGSSADGSVNLSWQTDTPVSFEDLLIRSGDIKLSGKGQVSAPELGLPVEAELRIEAADLSRFAAIAQKDIAGRATMDIDGQFTLLSGEFDLNLTATTEDLETGTPRLDSLLTGVSALVLDTKRDANGTLIRKLELRNNAVRADASGQLNTNEGQLDLRAHMSDLSLAEPTLSGPADIALRSSWTESGDLTLQQLDLTADSIILSASGTLSPQDPALPVNGSLQMTAKDLSAFAGIAKRPLTGQIDLSVSGTGEINNRRFSGETDLTGENLHTGIAELDKLIQKHVTLSAAAALSGTEAEINHIKLNTPQLTLDMAGSGPAAPVSITARLANLGLFAPGFDGPLSLDGDITLRDMDSGYISLSLDAVGPGDATVAVNGDIREFGSQNDLNITGKAPLGLINRFISPRSVQGMVRFALAVSGAPSLSSVSGEIDIGPARAALPSLNTALEELGGTIALSSGQAALNIRTQIQAGGSITVRGPVTLSPPFSAGLDIGLTDVILQEPSLYHTSTSGDITINGPLTDGALIAGKIALSDTEIRIPAGTTGIAGAIPEITHINEPSSARSTRRRAGLIKPASTGTSASYPLDITIQSTNGVFVRGRGLDSELGGRIRLTGTTDNIEPSGVFELVRGRLEILGQRLDLTEGLIDLRGALDPYLRFVAEATSDDFIVQIILEGLASDPEITFASQPELPQEEVVSRLLFGRGLDNISPFQAAQLASSVATLAGGGEGITGKIRSAFGLSDFDVTSSAEGETQVRAGAYISDNIYSEVTAGQDGTRKINLNLDLSSSVTAKGSAGSDGSTGVGLFFERDY